MGLEATHIRFALDLKEDLDAKDLNKYLSGAIYPDSRHVTKLERKVTHNFDLVVNKDFYRCPRTYSPRFASLSGRPWYYVPFAVLQI